jgi:stress response protein SCP2
MALITVKGGQTRKLPPTALKFSAGMGWDAAVGQSDSPDLDLWILRHRAGGVVEVISWANKSWERPDLGQNSQKNPYIATPELDVIHQGDDRTGAVSQTGYDEIAQLDLSKAPADTEKYSVFGTIYDEKNPGATLGMASGVKFGVTDEASGHTVETDPAASNTFDVSVALATIDKGPDGSWSLTAIAEDKRGTSDDMFKVCKALGAQV